MPIVGRAVLERTRRTVGTITLCAFLVTGMAACKDNPQVSAGPSSRPSAAAAGEDASPSASAAPGESAGTPSEGTAASATAAAAGAAKTTPATAKTTHTAGPAPAGAKVTSASITLMNRTVSGPCPAQVRVAVNIEIKLNTTAQLQVKAQLRSSENSGPVKTYANHGGTSGNGEVLMLDITKGALKRTVDLWVETTAPSRMTSPHYAFTIDCMSVKG